MIILQKMWCLLGEKVANQEQYYWLDHLRTNQYYIVNGLIDFMLKVEVEEVANKHGELVE